LRRVRCRGWFDVNVSLHAEILERHALAFNELLSLHAKTSALKERPSRDADVTVQVTDTSTYGPRDNALEQRTGNALPLRLGMHIEEIETSCVIDSDETEYPVASLVDEDAASLQTPSPRIEVRRVRRPCRNLDR